MTAVALFFAIGILLLAVEIVAPGGILGILGGLSLLAGSGLAFLEFGPEGGLIATGVAAVLGAIVLYLQFVYMPKSKFIKALSMTGTVAGRSQPELADASKIVGAEGTTLTMLSPSGYVSVDGTRFEAHSQRGQIDEGTKVRVVGVDTFRLIVTPIVESL